jgi:hypothetical protein
LSAVLSIIGLCTLVTAGLVGAGLASRVAGAESGFVRGIFRFHSTDFAAMHAAGFNAATDGGVDAYHDQQAAAGITGMVWVSTYDNVSCAQTMSDSDVTAKVRRNVQAGHRGLVYQLGDEPTTNGCNAAPTYTHLTQLVHAADPQAKTWVADDQFMGPKQSSLLMKGAVDILAFDVYPCERGTCDFSRIDSALSQIMASIGDQQWQFIVQGFEALSWTWPSASEMQAQFDHWRPAMSSAHPPTGYWMFAWDYLDNDLAAQAHFGVVKTVNRSFASGPGSTPTATPSSTPTATPTPTPTPTGTPTPRPDDAISINGAQCAVMINGKLQAGTCSGTFKPGG